MKLYELTKAYRDLPDLIGQISDEDLKEIMKNLDNNLIAKVSNIASLIDEISLNCKALKEHEIKTKDKRTNFENKISYLKNYIKENMISMGKDIIQSPVLTIKLQVNPPKVEIIDETKIPEKYWKTKITKIIDKVQIKADYKATGLGVIGTNIIQEQRIVIK